MVVYNVYGLVYFVKDVGKYGYFECILFFLFENFLLKFKYLVRKLYFFF